MHYRMTSPVSAPPCAVGSTSRAQMATRLESYSCTNIISNRIRIIFLRKNTGGHPLAASLCCLGSLLPAKARRMSTYAKVARNYRRICTYGFIGLKVPVESTLAEPAWVGGIQEANSAEFRRTDE
jgi:hypothetical protein